MIDKRLLALNLVILIYATIMLVIGIFGDIKNPDLFKIITIATILPLAGASMLLNYKINKK